MMVNNHDHSYKLLFSHPEMVESLIRDFVPEDWVKELDFSSLEKKDKSYVSHDLRERHDDIIWRVKWRGIWCYVYLLIEFQSSVDPWMALRIMVYIGLLYQDLLQSKEIGQKDLLPPVFPLVLYNGLGPWTAVQDVSDLIMSMPTGLAKYKPSLQYFILDEGRVPEQELSNTYSSLAGLLIHLERTDSPEDLQTLVKELIIKIQEPKYSSLRRAFAVWIHRVLLKRVVPDETIPEVHDLEEVQTMLAERVTQWTEKWKNEGRQEGQRALLERLLRKRFGSNYTLSLQKRLQRASPEELDLWAERILDAQSIDEVFQENK